MGNKTKKHGKQSANDIFQYARRAMEKEDFKEALKNAKVCFRQDPSQEHRQLLERSWLARGLQLAHAGLQAEGRAAAQELLAMGVSEPDVKNGLPELLLAVGLYDLAVATGKIGGNGQAADPTILAHAADRAVIDPASAPASLPGIREGATRVRAALDALYGGDESAATAALGDVPRNSPFAAWKLFIRGLAAYYRQDDEAMRANWDRLDANRFAARLAVLLRRLADPACNSGDSASETRGQDEFRQAIRVLEKDLVGGPAVWYLESLQQSLRDRHWREAVTALRRWRKEFQTILPTLTQRLERFFYDMAVRRANRKWLTDLTTAIDPPRWDPRWNRARALISEAEEAGIETAENFWLVYLDDLATLPDLKPAERPLAQAMIWARIGGRWANEADHIEDEDEDYDDYEDDDYEDDDYEDDDEDDDEPDLNAMRSARAKAIECFNKAIGLAPDFAEAYHALAQHCADWKQEDAAAEAHRRLLANVPDDLDAIISLFHYHRSRDEGLAARDYALQALRIKPASEGIHNLVVAGRFLAARCLAVEGRYEEARSELAAVDVASAGSVVKAYELTVRRAIVEFKAGQTAAGHRLVEQALTESEDPADVYMALSIEAVRHELPFQLEGSPTQFWDRWLASLKKRRSRAAGSMSRRMWAFMLDRGQFSGKFAFMNDYLERLVKYVSGCTRISWQAGDLLDACRFLNVVFEDPEFREVRKPLVKFLDVGRKKFPEEAEFHLTRGEIEMQRGPTYCNRRLARECFEEVLELTKNSSSDEAKEMQQLANQRLGHLGGTPEASPRRGRSFAADDFAGMPPESIEGMSQEDLLDIVMRMSASMGLDPEEMMDKFAADFRFQARQRGENK